MSGEQRMRARVGASMTSAALVAQLGLGDKGAGATSGRAGGGSGAQRAPGDAPKIHSQDGNG